MLADSPPWLREIDHTGDIGIAVTAPSIAGLFERAAIGTFHVLTDLSTVRPTETSSVQVEGRDVNALMVRWLSELNYRHTVDRVLFAEFEVDALDRGVYARALKRLIVGCEAPMVVGLYGGWGVGKTSLMALIRGLLKTDGVPTVWFDPWKHQFEDDLILALLHTMVDELGKTASRDVLRTFCTVALALGSAATKKYLDLSFKDIKNIDDLTGDATFQERSARIRLDTEIRKLIEQARGGDAVADDAHWLIEGSADYYAALMSLREGRIDYETFRDVLERYTAGTGRTSRPPKWSFGTWMSRLGYESREELESIAARLREESIPSDVVHLDPFWMRESSACDLVWDTVVSIEPVGERVLDGPLAVSTGHPRDGEFCRHARAFGVERETSDGSRSRRKSVASLSTAVRRRRSTTPSSSPSNSKTGSTRGTETPSINQTENSPLRESRKMMSSRPSPLTSAANLGTRFSSRVKYSCSMSL